MQQLNAAVTVGEQCNTHSEAVKAAVDHYFSYPNNVRNELNEVFIEGILEGEWQSKPGYTEWAKQHLRAKIDRSSITFNRTNNCAVYCNRPSISE